MNENLAEKLLVKVMKWNDEQSTEERQYLQAMARYKYDHYQQFSPGMRFVESLAQWLSQFKSIDEKLVAYDFIKKRLIFCSDSEMKHLVSMAYPDYIRPLLLREAARIISCPEHLITKIARSQEFEILQRQSLFLSLSDGSHIDWFRRLNKEISHEQTCTSYDISEGKAEDLKKKLREGLKKITNEEPEEEMCYFRYLVLLDDFSGSGKSYLRKEGGKYDGKIDKVFNNINNHDSPLSKILDRENVFICTVIYMATEQAIKHLESIITEYLQDNGYKHELLVVHPLDKNIRVQGGQDDDFLQLVDKYYDSKVETDAMVVGGTEDFKVGFSNCRLPIVLNHNTPNNSVVLLWSHEDLKLRGLFPRVTRH
jgi:hypothetical protein